MILKRRLPGLQLATRLMHFRIGQFSDEQSNFVMGGSALKIDQGQVKESVKPQKAEVITNELLKNYVRYTLRKLA